MPKVLIAIVVGGAAILGASSAWAADERITPACTDYVAKVEINIFGDDPLRTSVIYRDADGSIIDWRWYTTPAMIPRPLGDGRYLAVWEDQNRTRIVITKEVVYVRSREDRELAERSVLPAEKRRKLASCRAWVKEAVKPAAP